jgi:diguanylate cyclase (GGDEF)-like protein
MPKLPKSPFLEQQEKSNSEADATRVKRFRANPNAKSHLKGYLTVIVGDQPGRIFEVSEPSMFVGRGPECDIRIDSDGVSRKHAWIRHEGDRYLIEDLKSTNGTWLDGASVKAGHLSSGVRIRVGTDVILRFNLLDDAEAALQQRLYDSGIQDTLTGVYNRRYFDQTLATEVTHTNRLGTSLAVLLLQVDDMKAINEYYTQAGGDAMLRELGQMIKSTRSEDIIARTGPDHFGVISRLMTREEASALAEKLRAGVEQLELLWQVGDFSMCIQSITACVAITMADDVPSPATDEAIMKKVTERLLEAKEQGGNKVISG